MAAGTGPYPLRRNVDEIRRDESGGREQEDPENTGDVKCLERLALR